jgi:hypothetical protein
MLKKRLSNALVSLIALMVLNFSVDTAFDPVPVKWNGTEYTEDPNFNDIESIYELVTECWLDMDDDFVPEQDDDDGYETGKTLKEWVCTPPLQLSALSISYGKYYAEHIVPSYPSISIEVTIPPPDALG